MSDVADIAKGLTEAQRRAVLTGNVNAMVDLPWCDCDFRACGGWAWCKNTANCLGLAVRNHLAALSHEEG